MSYRQGTSRPPPLEKFIPLAKPRGGALPPPLGIEILGKCVCETLRITFSKKNSPEAGLFSIPFMLKTSKISICQTCEC